MSKVYYGLTSVSGASHWLGVGDTHPKTPIHAIVNIAFLVSQLSFVADSSIILPQLAWGIRAAFTDTILPFFFEEFDYDAHLIYTVHLWKSESARLRLSQHENEWIAKGGKFHD